MAVVYYSVGEAASSEERWQATAESATLKQWVHTATRYGTVVLALAYVMSFGLELSTNGWLATYYREAFVTDDLVLASTFAATFSLAAGLLRPFDRCVSDRLARRERDVLPVFGGRYREQWTFATLVFIVVAIVGMTLAGLTGQVLVAVGAGFVVGRACAFADGAIFAQVPAMFPDSSGSVAGVVDGVGTVGGIAFALVYSATLLPNLHLGYAVVAAVMVPIVLLNAWVYWPAIASRASVDGFFDSEKPPAEAPSDD